MGVLYGPALLLLRKLGANRWWIALPLAAIVGVAPLLVTCGPGGGDSECVFSSWNLEPLSWFALAGFCGGAYLWFFTAASNSTVERDARESAARASP
jgi:hypothetical protein